MHGRCHDISSAFIHVGSWFAKSINSTANYLMSHISYAGAQLKKNILGDAIEIILGKEEFVITELVKRAQGTNIGIAYMGPPALPVTPKVVMVVGSVKNITQVSDYGKNGDPKARAVFKIIDEVTNGESIITYLGDDAKKSKSNIRHYLLGKEAVDTALKITQKRFVNLMHNWQVEKSYQDQFSWLAANVIGECVFGIPELDIEYIPIIRELSDLITQNDPKSKDFLRAKKTIEDLSRQLFEKFEKELLNIPNFLFEEFQTRFPNRDEQIKKFKEQNFAVAYIVESNLSATLMFALIQIHQRDDIKNKLLHEIQSKQNEEKMEADKFDFKTINSMPYLDAVVKETLRFLSPTGLIARETSVSTTLRISDDKGNETQHFIPARSRLFTSVSCIHHNPKFWKNYAHFDPTHFLNGNEPRNPKEYRDHYLPFSLGTRACPAEHQFAPAVLKMAIILSLYYKFSFDRTLEQIKPIPFNGIQPRWDKEIFLKACPQKIYENLAEAKLDAPQNSIQARL